MYLGSLTGQNGQDTVKNHRLILIITNSSQNTLPAKPFEHKHYNLLIASKEPTRASFPCKFN